MTAHHDQHDQPSSFHPSNCHQLAPISSRNFRDMILIRQYHALLGTNIPPNRGAFDDDFPFLQVGYVLSLKGIFSTGCVSIKNYISFFGRWEKHMGTKFDEDRKQLTAHDFKAIFSMIASPSPMCL